MSQLKGIIVGYDFGQAKTNARVANAFASKNHSVGFFGHLAFDIQYLLDFNPDFVIVGFSANRTDEIELLERAQKINIPAFVVANTHQDWGRQAAMGRVSKAVAIVASPVEVTMAKKFGFGDAVCLGGPPHWQDFDLIKPVQLVQPTGHKVILVGGHKEPTITNALLDDVINAMNNVTRDWSLIFKPHPGEKEIIVDQPDQHQRRVQLLQTATVHQHDAETNELIGSVDCSIFTAGSEGTIVAAWRRWPVISWQNQVVTERLYKNTNSYDWFPAVMGANAKADCREVLYRKLGYLLFVEEEQLALRQRQEDLYTSRPVGAPNIENRILNFIAAQVAK